MAISLEEAREVLLPLVRVLPVEKIPLAMSYGRILADTLCAGSDFPPFDRSPLDGYALIASEVYKATPEQPVVLQQVDNVPAGSVSELTIERGTACRIMTGAPLPAGTTGVVRLENTEVVGDRVRVFDGREASKQICLQGEEIASGEQLIAAGTKIGFGAMGMLALNGEAMPSVYRQPRVALLATGSEIISVEKQLTPGKIRNSNSYMLSGQVIDAGSKPVILRNVPDEREAIIAGLQEAEQCDIVITTGGASVGDRDLIADVFRSIGINVLFERVEMKPGMPVVAGVKGEKLFLGLSGNPAAASISFEQIMRPLLLKMGGRKTWYRPQIQARLAAPFKKSTGAKRFVWARWWQEGSQLFVEPSAMQGNGMLKSAIPANSLIIIPANSPPLPSGTEVSVILLIDNN